MIYIISQGTVNDYARIFKLYPKNGPRRADTSDNSISADFRMVPVIKGEFYAEFITFIDNGIIQTGECQAD